MLDKEGVFSGTEVNAEIVYDNDKHMKVKEYKAKILSVKGDLTTMGR